MTLVLDAMTTLPADGFAGTLIGRAWVPAEDGPSVILIREDGVFDISRTAPTVSSLLNGPNPLATARLAPRDKRLGSLDEILANTPPEKRDERKPWLLAPVDLQALKAAGVTFAGSLLERVVEEQSRGDPQRAEAVRSSLVAEIGTDLSQVKPGSEDAARLKAALQARGLWSQYLEVGIGPDVEIFTKSQPMAAVGTGAGIGIHPRSVWNNPEPEIVLVVNAAGVIQGAGLGNDVNLRDFEGRSALLLSKAKDNTGSCAIGPFIRLFDESFTLDDVRAAEVELRVAGEDGFMLEGHSSMRQISRDPAEIVRQSIGASNQYPDGFAIFLGTMFAPTKDRGEKGSGFTHKPGDIVTIATPRLGALVNRVATSDALPPWRFGAGALMQNLARRGLLGAA
ncbi:MAG TPA: fumarylacetoacetate hydrolase family protein [Stellaceae bacterium]|nr:fumarylacetoacetate hydrolase family protein [Stellaceae bacterium]